MRITSDFKIKTGISNDNMGELKKLSCFKNANKIENQEIFS